MLLTDYKLLDLAQWQQLLCESPVASWFQSPEAYRFFCSLPELMQPFIVAVIRNESSPQAHPNLKQTLQTLQTLRTKQTLQTSQTQQTSQTLPRLADRESVANKETSQTKQTLQTLQGLVVGYVTKEHNPVKQFFTRRAIIYGGPLLADDITDDELAELLSTLNSQLSTKVIYIETRNFNDYSRWRHVFEQCGFQYQPHLNFHVDTSSVEVLNQNLGKNRKRDIRVSLRDGATIIENPTIEQVGEYYKILSDLYTTKVRTPLFPWEFFCQLYNQPSSRFLLVEYGGKIIGGTVCVVLDGKTVYEWFVCGEDGVHKNIFPSELATYAGMQYAAEHGCVRFDMMGAGTPMEHYGVRDFKARFGGDLVEHGRYLKINNIILYKLGKLGVSAIRRGGIRLYIKMSTRMSGSRS